MLKIFCIDIFSNFEVKSVSIQKFNFLVIKWVGNVQAEVEFVIIFIILVQNNAKLVKKVIIWQQIWVFIGSADFSVNIYHLFGDKIPAFFVPFFIGVGTMRKRNEIAKRKRGSTFGNVNFTQKFFVTNGDPILMLDYFKIIFQGLLFIFNIVQKGTAGKILKFSLIKFIWKFLPWANLIANFKMWFHLIFPRPDFIQSKRRQLRLKIIMAVMVCLN